MSTRQVRANCNEIGLQIIEKMYGDDYLSIGGLESTRILANDADVKRTAISESYGPRVYEVVFEKNGLILNAFEQSKNGGAKIVARLCS